MQTFKVHGESKYLRESQQSLKNKTRKVFQRRLQQLQVLGQVLRERIIMKAREMAFY